MVWCSRAEWALPVYVFRSWTKPALAKICCRPRLPHRPAFSLLLSCCVCSSTVRLVSQNCVLFPFCCARIPALDALPTLCLWSLVSRASLVLICLPERLPCLVLGGRRWTLGVSVSFLLPVVISYVIGEQKYSSKECSIYYLEQVRVSLLLLYK